MQTITLGRSSECDFSVEHPTTSRRHAVLTISDGDILEISDSDSKNGLFVVDEDGRWLRVRSARVRSSDKVRLGECELSIADILASVARKAFGATNAPPKGTSPKASSARVTRPGSTPGGDGGDEPLEKFRRPRRNPLTGAIEEGH